MMKKLHRAEMNYYFRSADVQSWFYFYFFKQLFKPVLADANHAAVVLVASSLVQHAGVDDVSDGDVQVVSTQMLQQLQGLVSSGLEDQNNEKKNS